MSLEGLKSLCKELGIGSGKFFFFLSPIYYSLIFSLFNNQGGSKQELACKIARIPSLEDKKPYPEAVASTSKGNTNEDFEQKTERCAKRKLTDLKEECKNLKLSHSKYKVSNCI